MRMEKRKSTGMMISMLEETYLEMVYNYIKTYSQFFFSLSNASIDIKRK